MRIVQLIDSLQTGGAERIAVNFANALANQSVESYLVVTRKEGLLKSTINSKVHYRFLKKTKIFDFKAIKYFNKFIKSENITIVHVHASSFFFATLAKIFGGKFKLIWHDHNGKRTDSTFFQGITLKLCSLFFYRILCVNNKMKDWLERRISPRKVSVLNNFAEIKSNLNKTTKLKGEEGKRIVLLANLRAPKNHLFAIEAFQLILKKHPDWSLHFVGSDYKDVYSTQIKNSILSKGLDNSIFLYGAKTDVNYILSQSQIGVLTSVYEGLPVSVLEYGLAKLPVICTDVGDCNKVIINNVNGVLIKSNNKVQLENALLSLINDTEKRIYFGKNLSDKINKEYSKETVIKTLLQIYNKIKS
ncbi:glycosyltransferase [Aurantibacter sp.]|uniref:glycosyltransferase n=1 Tax=Aurantibacter sp. TaxID=2807103 RepID=UPI0035C7FF5C